MAPVLSLMYVLPLVSVELLSVCYSSYNFELFTGGIGRGYWKIHVYSGLVHCAELLFDGIVSFVGTPVSLGSVVSDDRVTLTKGVACKLCIKQETKRNE
jgi:hypothetical protein